MILVPHKSIFISYLVCCIFTIYIIAPFIGLVLPTCTPNFYVIHCTCSIACHGHANKIWLNNIMANNKIKYLPNQQCQIYQLLSYLNNSGQCTNLLIRNRDTSVHDIVFVVAYTCSVLPFLPSDGICPVSRFVDFGQLRDKQVGCICMCHMLYQKHHYITIYYNEIFLDCA